MSPFSRRRFLRGLLGGASVAVGLPLFEYQLSTNGDAWAAGGALPVRFGMFHWGNGNLPSLWTPTGTGRDFTLSDQLSPLAALKDEISVVSGFEVKFPNNAPHWAGLAGFLSGRAGILGEDENHAMAGPTLDQVIAASLGGETRFRSLEFGAGAKKGNSHNGPHDRNPPETDPYALFQRLFGAGFTAPGEEPIIDPEWALRRSVLDAVLEDANDVRGQLGAADRVRLDTHMDRVRDLELQLARLEEEPPNLAACMRPDAPTDDFGDVAGRPQLQAKNRVMSEMVAMALACDQTRVFSSWFTDPVSNVLFPDAPDGHHNLTHDEPGDQPQVNAIVKQCVTAFAVQLEALRSIEEGDGTLLDNCLVLGSTDVSEGRTHSLTEWPVVLAGKAGGVHAVGQHLRSPDRDNAAKIALSIQRLLGMNVTSWGEGVGEVSDDLTDLFA